MHLFKDVTLFVPENMGKKDLLIGFGKVLGIFESSQEIKIEGLEFEIIECGGKTIVPGFFDSHVHITGGGGEGGYTTRIREGNLHEFISAGTTSLLGVLGTDGFSRSHKALLAKVRELNELGMNAFMMTGSYRFPPITITGDILEDIVLVPEIIGSGEFAVSDHRGSAITVNELERLCLDSHVAGMITKKSGKVIVHMGEAEQGMGILREVVEKGVVPVTQMIPTHVSRCPRLLEEAKEWVGKYGGYIDLTAKNQTAEIIRDMVSENVDLTRVTVTSDGLGSWPCFNERGEVVSTMASPVNTLLLTFRKLVLEQGFEIEKALLSFTKNPAVFFELARHGVGVLEKGLNADFVVFDENLEIYSVYLKGKKMF